MFTHPEWRWQISKGSGVHQWIKQLENPKPEETDIIIYGAPLSRSAISASGASQYPNAFRKGWQGFQSYNLDEQIDLRSLSVADIGNVTMHPTDVLLSQVAIEEASEFVAKTYPKSYSCLIGGDHSITACAVRGVKKAFPNHKIGIIQLDTHLDVRNHEEVALTDESPIRQLIEAGVVEGKHIYNIGLHGFFNAPEIIQFARDQGIHMITLKQMRRDGVSTTIREVLRQLMYDVDRIYVTVDMDVLDITFAQGVPASTPGGMTVYELFDILKLLGENEGVRHIDFVCLDPQRDTLAQATVKTGITTFLQWLTGIQLERKYRNFSRS